MEEPVINSGEDKIGGSDFNYQYAGLTQMNGKFGCKVHNCMTIDNSFNDDEFVGIDCDCIEDIIDACYSSDSWCYGPYRYWISFN